MIVVCICKSFVAGYNQDQNSTRTVRAIRRVTMSSKRRSPQRTFPCPLMSGFKSKSGFSISVVTAIVLGDKELRVLSAEAAAGDWPVALTIELGPPRTAIAIDFTFP